MTRLLFVFVFVYLCHVVQGSSNSTTFSCPQPTGEGTTRSVWNILGSCALTLLICAWHAIHLNLPDDYAGRFEKAFLIVSAFFVPEFVVMIASGEWWSARRKVVRFREKGYEWTMTHSFFAEMGGFVYQDNNGKRRKIKSLDFMKLCEANEIANPLITVKEIKDKSKSDALGKAVLAVQLLWFTLQVVVRGSRGLAVTLVELDMVSMAALTLLALWFWWEKPFRPECPHVFYSPQDVKVDPQMSSALRNAWKSESSYLHKLTVGFVCMWKRRPTTHGKETTLMDTTEKPIHSESGRLLATVDEGSIVFISLSAAWLVLSALHLIAWDFDFPTQTEKIFWRVASLILAGGPLLFLFLTVLQVSKTCSVDKETWATFGSFVLFSSLLSRTFLVGFVFASLRALPPSAYQTVSWTGYIPHL